LALDAVRTAGKAAAEQLESAVAPYARPLIENTAPPAANSCSPRRRRTELVKPLADLLGFDDVLATRYAHVDGVLTGAIDGGFVWSMGKLDAWRAWASEHGVDLAEELRVLRLDLRHAVAERGRSPRTPSTPIRACSCGPSPGGGPSSSSTCPPASEDHEYRAADVLKLTARPSSSRTRGSTLPASIASRATAGNHRGQPPLVLRHVALGLTVLKAGRSPRFLGKKEVVRRAGRRPTSDGARRHPRRPRHRVRRTAQARRRSSRRG